LDELELEGTINIQKLGYEFLDKPVIVGGLAMEYYGLRKHGDDIDFIVTDRDYQRLKVKFPACRKDVWGDFGILVNGFELFRSIYKLTMLTIRRAPLNSRIIRSSVSTCFFG
jgi:hypothetical protein